MAKEMGKVEKGLRAIVAELEASIPDAIKHDKGQVAGGTRLRKTATKVQDSLQGLKRQVLDDRKARDGS